MTNSIPFVPHWYPYRSEAQLVKAAIRLGDVVYTGWRHGEILQFMHGAGCAKPAMDDQGFIDERGDFYDRLSAAALLHSRGHPLRQSPLLSEDLWDNDGKSRLCQ
jgi:hypothetical protein